jgi:hypothetical protein
MTGALRPVGGADDTGRHAPGLEGTARHGPTENGTPPPMAPADALRYYPRFCGTTWTNPYRFGHREIPASTSGAPATAESRL